MKTCPNCGEDLDEEMVRARVCENCGEPFDKADDDDSDLEGEDEEDE